MIVNISYIEHSDVLKHNMWYTAEAQYQNIDVEFNQIHALFLSDYVQISPYYYKNKKKSKHSWSNMRQDLLMFDIDDGMTLCEIQDIFKNHTYVIYTTKSHQKDKKGLVCDRFRLIVPAENIPRDEDVYFTMLRLMRHRFKSDKQTETKSAGFLGNSDALVFSNDGRLFNCQGFADKAETIVALEAKIKMLEDEQKEARREFKQEYMHRLDPSIVKEMLDLETMIEIVDSLGIEVTRSGKCSIRDEGTPSTQLYADGGVHDFGGDSMDIFELVMSKLQVDFPSSLDYVHKFVRR